MAAFREYEDFDGLGLADLVKQGDARPDELIDAAIERIETHNQELNFVIHRLYDRARTQEFDPESRFSGVPFLLKDLTASLKGAPLQSGSRSRRWFVADHDSELVRRFKAAGLLILGKTNTPEFGLAPTTEPELHGPTRNPWDPTRTPGGSSGGSAVAVAVGAVPFAHANDGGGSIRIPASACGIFGLKPTRARTPLGPDLAENWFGLSVDHVVSRTVRDSAAILDEIQGTDAGAPYWAPPVEGSFRRSVGTDPKRLRIAFTTGALLGETVEGECQQAVRQAAQLCEELGHEVVEAKPSIDRQALTDAFVTIAATGAGFEVRESARIYGNKPNPDDYEAATWLLHLIASKTSAEDLAIAIHTSRQAGRTLAAFHEEYDVLITSTLGKPPWEIGALDPDPRDARILQLVRRAPAKPILDMVVARLADEILEPIPNTALFNMTGQPAMSVPLHWNSQNLPIGVQFVGRFGDEATLFGLAGQLEKAAPWSHRRPPVALD